MALAFRLYGKFQWPPTADAATPSATTADGGVEIHYAPSQNAADPLRRAFLYWRPKALFGLDSSPELPSDHLFNSTANDAAKTLFGDKADKPYAVWLDGTSPPGTRRSGI